MTRIIAPTVEHREQPLAIDADAPRFGWQLSSDERGVRQRWYRIVVRAGDEVLWDSGRVEWRETVGIEYAGLPLPRGAQLQWRIEGGTDDGEPLDPVDARFETAPDAAVWADAAWITRRRTNDQHDDHRPAPYLRRRVQPGPDVIRARLHVTAGGLYQLWADGERLTAATLAPGWTDYRHRVPFHSYDVTELARTGPFTLGAIIADGWYCGNAGPFHLRNFWGRYPVLKAVLVLEYRDGSRELVVTDDGWEAAFGPIQASDMLQGEVFDARVSLGDWSSGEPSAAWRPAQEQEGPAGRLVPALLPAAGPIGEIAAVAITEPVPGSFIVDLGQNFAGYTRLVVQGPAGTLVRLRHGEVLDAEGRLYTENLRGARATDTVVLAGDGIEVFEPSFTYHGFRYVEITGYPGTPTLETVTGVPISSIAEFSGEFSTDNTLVNQLQHNIQWSMLSNFIEVPTDCPSRDERMGWTGDAQIFAPTSTFNADLSAFYTKWMDDIDDARMANGALPDIAPCLVMEWAREGSSGYAEAGLIVPWVMYQAYGDRRILERHFGAGAAWVAYVEERSTDLVWRDDKNTDYGDWLAPVETPKDLTSTAYFARSAWLLAEFARVLGRADDEQRYRGLFERIAAAFRREFVKTDGTMPAGTQTAYTLALRFDLLLDHQRETAARELVADIEERGHIGTGFLAVAQLLPLLTEIGRSDLAYRLLLREEYPSWGHPIVNGATTIWERWDGWRAETGFQDPLMNSFNHFALGSVGEWLYASVAGLRAGAPGYASVLIEPRPGRGVNHAAATHRSIRGSVSAEWSLVGDRFELVIDVPANVDAEVLLPVSDGEEGGRALADADDVLSVSNEWNGTRVRVGSGRYSFGGVLLPAVVEESTLRA